MQRLSFCHRAICMNVINAFYVQLRKASISFSFTANNLLTIIWSFRGSLLLVQRHIVVDENQRGSGGQRQRQTHFKLDLLKCCALKVEEASRRGRKKDGLFLFSSSLVCFLCAFSLPAASCL